MTIQTKYDIGDIVYHRLDNRKGIVTLITVSSRDIAYYVVWASNDGSECTEIELSWDPCPDWANADT